MHFNISNVTNALIIVSFIIMGLRLPGLQISGLLIFLMATLRPRIINIQDTFSTTLICLWVSFYLLILLYEVQHGMDLFQYHWPILHILTFLAAIHFARFNPVMAKHCLLILIGCSATFAILSVLGTNFRSNGLFGLFRIIPDRQAYSFWNAGIELSATVNGIYLSLGMGLINTYFWNISNRLKITFFGIALFALISLGVTITRSPMLGFAVTLALLWFFTYRQKGTKFLVYSLVSFTVLITGLLIIPKTNEIIFGIFDAYSGRSGTGARFELWQAGIEGIKKNPWGGEITSYTSIGSDFAHNYWIDTGDVYGIIPMILLMIFHLIFFVGMIKQLKNVIVTEVFIITLGPLSFAFLVEPIIYMNQNLLTTLSIIMGISVGLVAHANSNDTISNPIDKT